jgi:hypothetical protein
VAAARSPNSSIPSGTLVAVCTFEQLRMWPPCRLLRGAAQEELSSRWRARAGCRTTRPTCSRSSLTSSREDGAKVTVVGSAEEALAALQWERPDVPHST